MADNDNQAQTMNDKRYTWLKQRTLQITRAKDDKWVKMEQVESNSTKIMNWYEIVDVTGAIFFFINNEDELTISEYPPVKMQDKKKTAYFCRTQHFAEKIPKDTEPTEDQVMYGELNDNVLGTLSAQMDNVFIPLLKASTKQWPELLQKDISQQCDQFSQQIQIIKGRLQNQYILPLPNNVEELCLKLRIIKSDIKHPLYPTLPQLGTSSTLISILPQELKEETVATEQIVLEWIKQIRHLIYYQPEDRKDLSGKNPTPSTEIVFWEKKAESCKDLILTLMKPSQQAVFKILELIQSSYYDALKQSFTELKEEHARCASTYQFLMPLKPLKEHFSDFNMTELQIEQGLDGFFKGLQQIWYHAPFYGNQTRLTFVIRALANQIIDWSIQCLSAGGDNGREVLKNSEFQVVIQNVQLVCRVADMLIEKYAFYSKEVAEKMLQNDVGENDSEYKQQILQKLLDFYDNNFEKELEQERKKHFEDLKKEGKIIDGDVFEPVSQQETDSVKYGKHFYKKGDKWPAMALVFKRLESFVERMKDVHKIVQIRSAFESLSPDKFEIGGVQGDKLSTQLKKINQLFADKVAIVTEVNYDPTDVSEQQFGDDMQRFMKHYNSLEKRLTSILTTAVETSITIEQSITCFEVFSEVLNENILKSLALKQFPLLNNKFKAKLDDVITEFNQQKEKPTLEPNMPAQSGKVFWARVCINRVRIPFIKLEALYNAYLEQENDELFEQNKLRYSQFVSIVNEYEKQIYEEWSLSVNDKCVSKLEEYLLKRQEIEVVDLPPRDSVNCDDSGKYTVQQQYKIKLGEREATDQLTVQRNYELDKPVLLQTNFSQELFDILSETKLFKILNKIIPEKAQEVYDKGNDYRQVKNQLDDIVNKYNYVQKQLYYVERPLFYSQLKFIEDQLVDGTSRLKWIFWKDNKQEVETFINNIQTPIEVLNSQVITLRDSLKQIEDLLKSWAKQPMIEKPAKQALVLDKVMNMIQNKCQQFKRENLTKIRQEKNGQSWDIDVDKITTNISKAKNVVFLQEVKDLYTLSDSARAVASTIKLSEEDESALRNYWEFYQVWLSEYLQSGLLEIIISNIKYLQKYMDDSETVEHNDFYQKGITPSEQSYPFVEISMNIQQQTLFFDPGCDNQQLITQHVTSISQVLLNWIAEMSKITNIVFNPVSASTVESLRNSTLNNYLFKIQENQRYKTNVQELLERVENRANAAKQTSQITDNYQDIFKTDKRQYLQRFLLDGPNVPLMGDYTVDPDKKHKVVRTIIRSANKEEDQQDRREGEEEEENAKKANDDDDDMNAGQVVQEEQELYYFRKPDIHDFNEAIDKYQKFYEQVQNAVPHSIRLGWLSVRCVNARNYLMEDAQKFKDMFINNRIEHVKHELLWLQSIFNDAKKVLCTDFSSENFEKAMRTLQEIKNNSQKIDFIFDPLKQIVQMLQRHGKTMDATISTQFESLPKQWVEVKSISMVAKEKLAPLQLQELQKLNDAIKQFTSKVTNYREGFRNEAPFQKSIGVDNAYIMLDKAILRLDGLRENAQELQARQQLFDQGAMDRNSNAEEMQYINYMEKELKDLKAIWDLVDMVETQVKEWKKTLFADINTDQLAETLQKLQRQTKTVDAQSRTFPVFKDLDQYLKKFLNTIPLITNLRDKSLRPRHWDEFKKIDSRFIIDDKFTLADLLELKMDDYQEKIAEIVETARKQLVQETQIQTLNNIWKGLFFNFYLVTDKTQTPLTTDQVKQALMKNEIFGVQVPEDLANQLEQDQMIVSTMAGNQNTDFFKTEIDDWTRKLGTLDQIITVWSGVQRTWSYLKPIFKFSDDIRRQLPDDTKRFEMIDLSLTSEMNKIVLTPNALIIAEQKEFLQVLERNEEMLKKCEKALADYLDTKRRIFPRFYFVSSVDLLDILSKGQTPRLVERHLSKIFDNIHTLKWQNQDDMECKVATEFLSGEKENVPFLQPFQCKGQVENWLNDLVVQTRLTLKNCLSKAINQYIQEENKQDWLRTTLAQICIVALQIYWTAETQNAFDKMAENNENAMKEYNKKQNDALLGYIAMIQGDLPSNMRIKISTICTIEVHSKDIVATLIKEKISNQQSFAWQSQLKFYWDEKIQDCIIRICDADFQYSYEYLGCQTRLVITPLTDRCYITLTQSLHLNLGGAPAGPAGTGKTETTKDLGRALGRMVYVFNCSPEMDYKSLGNIFYGLSLSGSWGCFDEFNRISIEVLSVVAMQVKSVLDAIRAKKEYFSLEGDDEEKPNMPKAKLNRQVGYFITMNPGYAGRTELPDNLKALFRSMSMVVPDFCQITEIMLISNGFMGARELAKKFTTLYSLNKELLSKSDHYDWGLRAIIAICRTAGVLRRQMIKSNDQKKADQLAEKNKSFSKEK